MSKFTKRGSPADDSEFEPIRLLASNGPDLDFDGRQIGFYSTQNRAGTKKRWQELTLWETRGGNWVAELAGCSSVDGEGEIVTATVIKEKAGAKRRAMEAFGWSTAAKAFAREMGWDVVERVP